MRASVRGEVVGWGGWEGCTPITEYWKNHAMTLALPTSRYGARQPSAKTMRADCCSCPEPETCELFITMAIFSSGTVAHRTITA